MATSTLAIAQKAIINLVMIALLLSRAVIAENATTSPLASLPPYFNPFNMVLTVRPQDAGTSLITLAPLTNAVGLNATNPNTFKTFNIQGTIALINQSSLSSIEARTVAYVSCDSESADSSTVPSNLLNNVMEYSPRGIVLYSLMGNACSLSGSSLGYESIWTMTNSNDSQITRSIIQDAKGEVAANVSANITESGFTTTSDGTYNSSIAMSILYAITGLIAVLFLIIIATGAVRAHRHPERYGPNAIYGGRPRQGRARGLARAVLETLPIVKFGNPHPVKPDPEQELENMSVSGERTQQHGARLSQATNPGEASTTPKSTAPPHQDTETRAGATTGAANNSAAGRDDAEVEEHLGCSICTEDFQVGEDVRVLPCNHKFHPPCIDPWLVNVSGTCPLCRLDLHPPAAEEDSRSDAGDAERPSSGPALEEVNEAANDAHRRRRSRLLDWNGLRHATVDERIEALRQFRQQETARAIDSSPEERSRRAKFADKLREKFHIRTRTQEAQSSREPGRIPES